MSPPRALMRPAGAVWCGAAWWCIASGGLAPCVARMRRVLAWRVGSLRLGRVLAEIADAERGRFVLWLPVLMGTGILTYFALRAEPPAWIGASIAVLGFGMAIASASRATVRACGFSVGFAALGFASAQYSTARRPPIEADLPTRAVLAMGTVRVVEILPNGRRITLIDVDLTDGQLFSPRARAGIATARAIAAREAPTRQAPVDEVAGDEVPGNERIARNAVAPGAISPEAVARDESVGVVSGGEAKAGEPGADALTPDLPAGAETPRSPVTAGETSSAAGDAAPPVVRHLIRAARFRLMAGDDTAVATGDRISVRAMAFPPSSPALPGGWDTQRDAFFAGLGASGYALGRVEVTSHVAPDQFVARVQRLREIIAARITAVVPGSAGAVAVTLLTGASRGIPEEDHSAFRESGLAHLLAVAGLHIGIVMGFALGVARTALALSERASLFWPTKKIAAVLALSVGGAYMVLTGGHVPIVRSFAMACLFTVAILVGRQPVSVRGLGLAGIALMLIAPYEVAGVSFQMSFSAVLALISGYETLRPWLRRLYGKSIARRLLSYVAALALTSTLAGTASLPYGAYHFGHIQIYYVVSNMIAVPITALWVLPAGMVALVLMPFGLEWLALIPMGWGATAIIHIARFTAALPSATIAAAHMPAWGLAVLSLGIAWLGIWRSRLRLAGLALIAAGLISPAFDRLPDILVSADAGMIGLRTDQGVFLQRTRGNATFTRDAWFGRWNVKTAEPMPALGPAALGALICARDSCMFRPRNDAKAALLVRGPTRPTGCADAAVVVSAEPARSVCPWPSPRAVDRFTVWKNGAAAIWLETGGARVLTDREERGERPWVPPPPKPRPRPFSNLPLAPPDREAP